jgi:hypothetical protein
MTTTGTNTIFPPLLLLGRKADGMENAHDDYENEMMQQVLASALA